MEASPYIKAATTLPDAPDQILAQCISKSQSRLEFWAEFIQRAGVRHMAEIGVYRGDFATFVLQRCDRLARYYMLDPWRHLEDWNKPANHDDPMLSEFFHETMNKTAFAASKRIILRGKTTEVVDQIADGELDLAYIDADHTLKGIAIDLIRLYPKVRAGGFLGGDDFNRSVWQHNTAFEPTLVFPFAVYFAEAVGATIYALPYSQFLLQKPDLQKHDPRKHDLPKKDLQNNAHAQFGFIDLTGQYDDLGLQNQFVPKKLFKIMAGERFPRLKQIWTKLFSR
jgi:hypothetical protein